MTMLGGACLGKVHGGYHICRGKGVHEAKLEDYPREGVLHHPIEEGIHR